MSRTLAAVALAGFLAAGCGQKSDAPVASGKSGHGHDHGSGDTMYEDVGPYHFGLTAHLSEKEGNELDIVIETAAKEDPKPVPLPIAKIAAKAKRDGDPKEYDLTFEPADKSERKDDPDGKCSRFTAKAAWMKPDDKITVTTAPVEVEKKVDPIVWKDFVPKKYSHHHD